MNGNNNNATPHNNKSMATNIARSPLTAVSCMSLKACADIFTNINIIGIINGKLNTASSVELWLLAATNEAKKVKVTENPKLPKNKISRNKPISFTGLSPKNINKPHINKLNTNSNKVL